MNETFTKKISDHEENLIIKYLEKFIVANTSQHIKYCIKTKNYVITIYNNKTILIQGKEFQNVLKLLNVNFKKQEAIKHSINGNEFIGSDESGNGDLFGGISVCAVFVEKDNINKLKELGVKDSKELTDEQMIDMVPKIKKLVSYEHLYISANEYNDMFDKYQNINTIKTLLHLEVINKLFEKINRENLTAIIDQYCNDNLFKKHLEKINKKLNVKYHLETKAENKYIQIAVASIIARVGFINELKNIGDKINIKLPNGSVDTVVLPVLKKLKEEKKDLKCICKLHFKSFNKI